MNKEIIKWLIYIIYVGFFNIGWLYGLRHYLKTRGGFTRQTAATTMLMTITSIVFLFSDINKFHLIWLAPFFIFISGSINALIFSIPLIGPVYAYITNLFSLIVTFGVKTDKTPYDYVNVMSNKLNEKKE